MCQHAAANTTDTDGRTGSHMVEHTPEAITKAKERYMKGEEPATIPTVEGWSQTLASVSEATIKAEKAPEMSMEDLQNFTVKVVHEEQTVTTTKKGIDKTQYPALKENLEESKKGHDKQGHGKM